jgi:integrase
MATVPGLKKVGPFWHYSIQVNGQRAHGSTKATDLTTARRVMEEKRRVLLHDQLNLTKRVPPSLNQIWDAWWKANQTAFSLKHLVSVECRYRRWIKPDLGSVRVDRLKADLVLGVRTRQLEAGCSGRYANNTLEILRTLARFAIRLGHIDHLPFQVKPLRLQRKPRPTVPAGQVSSFLATADAAARNPQIGVMFRTLIALGLREGELLGMRWEWLDLDRMTYQVGKAKGKEARIIPVPTWLATSLLTMPKRISEWVFPAEDGSPHRSGYLRKPLGRIAKKLQLGPLTLHRLRATFATLHAESGTPVTEIQGMLGHKAITTTQIYLETSLDAKRRAQDALGQKLGLA